MSRVECAVFDVDGTILNTFEHIVQAFEVVLPHHGAPANRESIRKVIGKKLIDCYKALVPDGNHEAMAKLHHETQQTPEMYDLILAYDGLREAREELAEEGIASAIQTNRSRLSIDLIFNHLQISGLFYPLITPEDVSEGKPDPEGINIIAARLGITTAQMVMVGDTHIDVETARKAHMAGIIGITHGFGTREELHGADVLIDSLAELPEAIRNLNGS